ncbi:MAG: hypothetical protein ACR2NL_03785 [Acidimicrobiia bacterium]
MRRAWVLVACLVMLASGCSGDDDAGTLRTTTTDAPTTTTTIDRAEVMARIEELFGSGDLLGVELSIDVTGEVVIFSDELTPEQKQRIEDAIGEVTYSGPVSSRGDVLDNTDCSFDETQWDEDNIRSCQLEWIERIDLSADRQTLTVSFTGLAPFRVGNPCSGDYVGWARVNGDVLEVAVAFQHVVSVCPLVGYGRQVTVTLDEPFDGTEIQDIASDFVLVLEPPP